MTSRVPNPTADSTEGLSSELLGRIYYVLITMGMGNFTFTPSRALAWRVFEQGVVAEVDKTGYAPYCEVLDTQTQVVYPVQGYFAKSNCDLTVEKMVFLVDVYICRLKVLWNRTPAPVA